MVPHASPNTIRPVPLMDSDFVNRVCMGFASCSSPFATNEGAPLRRKKESPGLFATSWYSFYCLPSLMPLPLFLHSLGTGTAHCCTSGVLRTFFGLHYLLLSDLGSVTIINEGTNHPPQNSTPTQGLTLAVPS